MDLILWVALLLVLGTASATLLIRHKWIAGGVLGAVTLLLVPLLVVIG